MNDQIRTLINQEEANMVEFRRYLHQYPELSLEEFETTTLLAKELDKLGISYQLTEPTGIIATIEGGEPGKTVLLRGDMDALSVTELNDALVYKSTTAGKMHACGHDAHTAMLLTAAKILVTIKDQIKGQVRLVFQPAEEIAIGAKLMIDQGATKNVDNVFGIHIWSVLPSGQVSCYPGPCFAAADRVSIRFEGQGGHAAMPQQCVDAAIIASQYVVNIQSIISREIDPLNPAVITIGKIDVGQRFNVIAQDAYLEGTVRTFHKETRDIVEQKMKQYADEIAAVYGATAIVDYVRMTEVVDNDETSAKLVQSITEKAFGKAAVGKPAPTMGGEDFGFFMVDNPGAFALVGCADEAKDTCWAHHHGKFNVDEDSMKIGAELYVRYALDYLAVN